MVDNSAFSVWFSSIGTGKVLQCVSDNQARPQASFWLLGLLHFFAASFFCKEGDPFMEEMWIADRSTLRHVLSLHPSWTHPQFADCLHRSLSWGKPVAQAFCPGRSV
jgi:hypothetical protein